jgi:hypothetical protein
VGHRFLDGLDVRIPEACGKVVLDDVAQCASTSRFDCCHVGNRWTKLGDDQDSCSSTQSQFEFKS